MGRSRSTYVLQIGESSARIGSGTGSKIISALNTAANKARSGGGYWSWTTSPKTFDDFKVKGNKIYIDPKMIDENGYIKGTRYNIAADCRYLFPEFKRPNTREASKARVAAATRGKKAEQKASAEEKPKSTGAKAAPKAARPGENELWFEAGLRGKIERGIKRFQTSNDPRLETVRRYRKAAQEYSRNNFKRNAAEKAVRDAEFNAREAAKASGDTATMRALRAQRTKREAHNLLVYGLGTFTGHNEYRMYRGKKILKTGSYVTMKRMKSAKRALKAGTRTYIRTIGKHVNPTSIIHRRFEILRSTYYYGVGMRRRYGTKVGWAAAVKRYKTKMRKENRRFRRRFIRRVQRKAQDLAFTPWGRLGIRVGIRSAVQYRNYRNILRKRGQGFFARRIGAARYVGRYTVARSREVAALRMRGGTRATSKRYIMGQAALGIARKIPGGKFVFGSGVSKREARRQTAAKNRERRARARRSESRRARLQGMGIVTSAQRTRLYRMTHARKNTVSSKRKARFASAKTSAQRSAIRQGRNVYSSYFTASNHRKATGGKSPKKRKSSWTKPHKR